MTLTGELLIGAADIAATEGTMKALNPATNREIEPGFALGGRAEVDLAVRLADEAFDSYSHTTLAARAAFLERIADNLDAVRTELAERAALETGLPTVQLEAEAAKAATQFRQFAEVVRKGRFLQATIDPAQPERQPAAKPGQPLEILDERPPDSPPLVRRSHRERVRVSYVCRILPRHRVASQEIPVRPREGPPNGCFFA